jgi:hypothetical protein
MSFPLQKGCLGRSPIGADGMMPWQGLAWIGRLPQACVNAIMSSIVDSPQVRPAPSISASTSDASISRKVSAPSALCARPL